MKTFTLIYFIGFIDLLAVSLIIPSLHRHLQELGASSIAVGFADSLYGALQIFSSPLMGNWSDTKGRKITLLICILIAALSYLILGISSYLWLALFTRISLGIFKQSQTLSRAYLADIASDEEKPRVFGNFNAISSLGFIVGPAIGGHLSEIPQGFKVVCITSSMLFLFSFALLLICLPSIKPVKHITSDRKTFDALKLLTELNWENYWDVFVVKFFLSLAVLVYRNNFALILTQTLELPARFIGYIISFYSVVSATSGFLTGFIAKFYTNYSSLLQHSAFLQTASLISLTFASTTPSLMVCLIPFALSNAVSRICVTSITVQRCNENERGKVVGVGQSITSTSRMIAPLLSGFAQHVTIYGSGLTGIFCSSIGVLFIGILNKNMQKVTKVQ